MMAKEYEVLEIAERTRLNDANRPERYFQFRVKSAAEINAEAEGVLP